MEEAEILNKETVVDSKYLTIIDNYSVMIRSRAPGIGRKS
jgi:hypothetical protein